MMEDDPRFDPVIRRYDIAAWAAAVAALLLIGFVTLSSFNSSYTASNGSSPPTTASRIATPPNTEGSGSSSPKPTMITELIFAVLNNQFYGTQKEGSSGYWSETPLPVCLSG